MTFELLWRSGWALVSAGLLAGALLGAGFARESFLGGYGAWRRRLLRLGHIAAVMLGVLSMLAALSPAARASTASAHWIPSLWVLGGWTMPAACALAAWRPATRFVFALPVALLVAAALLTMAAC